MFPKKIRVSSGVDDLDQLLGGLFIGDNVIWYDDAGSLAETFSLNFIRESQREKKALVYVSFDRSPKSLIQELGPMAESRYLTILDCFTHGKGDGSDIFNQFYRKDGARRPYQVVKINEPWKPESVIESVYALHRTLTGDVRFVFESLTGMQDLWGGEEHVLKFYSRSCPRLYELETIAYWVIEKGAHSDRLKAHINQVTQVAIDLSMKRGKSSLTILKADKRKPETLNKPNYYWNDGLLIHFEDTKRTTGKIDLGRRLKEVRTKQGMSQKDLAVSVGVTPSTISQIESNLIYPSLPALFKIAETLSVEVSSLFKGVPDFKNQMFFSGPGTEVTFSDLPKGGISGSLLTRMDFNGRVAPYRIDIPAGGRLTSHFFKHKGEEMGYLLSGRLQVSIRSVRHEIKAGDVVYLTHDVPDAWENPYDEPAEILWLVIQG